MATKFSTKTVRDVRFYLRSTDANFAFNKFSFQAVENVTTVRGFVGVVNPESEVIEGAFCWGANDSLCSISFEINLSSRLVGINVREFPIGWSPMKAEKTVKGLLLGLTKKLHDRMIARSAIPKKATTGSYVGPRLEAWKRLGHLPANKFQSHKDKFTDEFASRAHKLHITYR